MFSRVRSTENGSFATTVTNVPFELLCTDILKIDLTYKIYPVNGEPHQYYGTNTTYELLLISITCL